jgi:hypothetical protein
VPLRSSVELDLVRGHIERYAAFAEGVRHSAEDRVPQLTFELTHRGLDGTLTFVWKVRGSATPGKCKCAQTDGAEFFIAYGHRLCIAPFLIHLQARGEK